MEQPDPIKSALEACILAIEFYMTTEGDDDEKIARCQEKMMDAATKGRGVLKKISGQEG